MTPFGMLTPEDIDPSAPVPAGGLLARLLGLGGQERFQTWPERMVRSAVALPGEVASGAMPIAGPGLRREDFTDQPAPMGLGSPVAWQPNDPMMERAQDLSALAIGGALPAVAARGVEGMARSPTFGSIAGPGALEAAPKPAAPFYSAVERAVAERGPSQAPAEQWAGTIKNTPGVKPEEMDWIGLNKWLAEQKGPVTKQAVQDFVAANKVEIRDVVKSDQAGAIKSEADLEAMRPAEYGMLVRADLEPTLDPGRPGRMGFLTKDGDITDWSELRDSGAPESIWRAARSLEDAAKGGEPMTRHSGWQLPGGENYRETLLALPKKTAPLAKVEDLKSQGWTTKTIRENDFTGQREVYIFDPEGVLRSQRSGTRLSPDEVLEDYALSKAGDASKSAQQAVEFKSPGHWGDEPNVIAHVRSNERIIDGKKTLFAEEFQSDWHQKGRKMGYESDPKPPPATQENMMADQGWRHIADDGTVTFNDGSTVRYPSANHANDQLRIAYGDDHPEMLSRPKDRVPDAPFKKTWHELALKKMIREAAERGHDQIAWTPGEVQAARYDLSKQIDLLNVERIGGPGSTLYTLTAKDKNGRHHNLGAHEAGQLPDAIGKDMAERILKNEDKVQKYEGVDLKVGGEGMKGFYDKMMVDAANKLGKPFGAKVGSASLGVRHTTPAEVKDFISAQTHLGDGVATKAARDMLDQHEYEFGQAIEDAKHRISEAREMGDGPEGVRYGESVLAELEIMKRLVDRAASGSTDSPRAHVLELTPAMKKAALEKGFPLFVGGVPVSFGSLAAPGGDR